MPRPCTVTLVDIRGIRHVAEVSAESLFEAAVLGLQAFKSSGWTDGIGSGTRLEVEVRAATTRHVVSVAQIERWAEGSAASPAERLRRDRLREILRDATAAHVRGERARR